ncbi:LysR family transcriptional regulator [soil metagenome]
MSTNLSLKQLRAFLAVADSGSFTEAARRLNVTQSALSLLVKDMESEIGFKLLNRTTRKVALSDAGREFHPMVQKVLDELESVIRGAAEVAMVRRGIVRIAATEAVACTLVTPAIAAYRQHRPSVEVRLVDTLVGSMLIPLRNGDVDYVVGPASLAASNLDAQVAVTPLFQSPFSIFCPEAHPLTAFEKVPANELLKYELIVPSADFTTRLMPQLRSHLGDKAFDRALASTLPNARQVANMITGLSLAAAGLGVMIAPHYLGPLASNFGLAGRVLVRPSMTRVVALYTRKSHALSPSAQDFLSFVHGLIAERGLKAVSASEARR